MAKKRGTTSSIEQVPKSDPSVAMDSDFGNAFAVDQMSTSSDAADPDDGAGVLNGLLEGGGGSALPSDVASQAQSSFGSVSGVTIHTDPTSGGLAQDMGMAAFAYGSDVFFAPGEYDPDGERGRHILLHELAHTRQMGESAPQIMGHLPVASGTSSAEVDADNAASAALSGESYQVGSAPHAIHGFGATARVDEEGNRVETDICHENQTLDAAEAAGLSEEQGDEMYSGNWQQDMNQALLPAGSDEALLPIGPEFSAEDLVTMFGPAIYEILNIAHFAHFGFGLDSSEEFGTYDPVAHLDNPGGQTGADVFDQASDSAADENANAGSEDDVFHEIDDRYADAHQHMSDNQVGEVLNPDDALAYQVDESGIPVYMTASALQMHDVFESAARAGGEVGGDGLTYAGEALHIMQDFYAHSNFCEIAINILLQGTYNENGELDDNGTLSFAEATGIDVGEYTLDTGVHALDENGERI